MNERNEHYLFIAIILLLILFLIGGVFVVHVPTLKDGVETCTTMYEVFTETKVILLDPVVDSQTFFLSKTDCLAAIGR